jgi:hypothetical protein
MNRIAPLVALAAVLAFATAAEAQCCYTTYYQPATVYYSAAPVTTAYYAAAPTTTYYAAPPATVYYAPRAAYYAPAYYPARSAFYRGWRW